MLYSKIWAKKLDFLKNLLTLCVAVSFENELCIRLRKTSHNLFLSKNNIIIDQRSHSHLWAYTQNQGYRLRPLPPVVRVILSIMIYHLIPGIACVRFLRQFAWKFADAVKAIETACLFRVYTLNDELGEGQRKLKGCLFRVYHCWTTS
jgi:hypothetical protein